LKYFLNKSTAISLGLEYMSRDQTSNIKRQYILAISPGAAYSIHRDISPYSISTKGYIPTSGIHLGKRITRSLEIEGFISGGIIFAECGLLWEYQGMEVLEVGIELDDPDFSLQDAQLNGKGTGFALKGGARINIDMGKNVGLFLEGEYAHQEINNLSGPGSNTEDFVTETWNAEWGVKGNLVVTDWGTVYYVWPSNYWRREHKDYRIGDFKLDLSGFRMKIGIFCRF
jgi:hypothetical protein